MEIKVNSELKYIVDSIDGKEGIPDEEVFIQDTEPEDGKIWIDTGEISNLGTEVVDSLEGNQSNKAPSVRAVLHDLIEVLYPVGAIYMSTISTSPKTLFGVGEWEQITDTFLMSAGTTYGAGTTGGSASVSHSHGTSGVVAGFNMFVTDGRLYHDYNFREFGQGYKENARAYIGSNDVYSTSSHNETAQGGVGIFGNVDSTSISNLPPYLAVYTWKRIS